MSLLGHILIALTLAAPPAAVTNRYVEGVVMMTEGRYEEALEAYEAALALEPNHDPSLYGVAMVLGNSHLTEDIARALDYSLRAKELDPENESYGELRENLLSLVDVRISKAFYGEEAEEVLTLVELRRRQPETDRMRGNFMKMSALQLGGRYRDARKVVEEMLGEATTDSLRSELHGAMGSLWHEESESRPKSDNAIRAKLDKKTFAEYDRALEYNRDNVLVLNNYAYYLAEQDRELDRALGMASRAVKREGNNATYLDTYAWVLYKLGDYAEAKEVMQRALPLDREESAELLSHYADILSALGEEFMAETYRKRAAAAAGK